MDSPPEPQDQGRRRHGLRNLFLVLAVVLGLLFYRLTSSAQIPTHLHLGEAAPRIAEIELVWTRTTDTAVMHEARYRFDAAPEDLYRTLRLRPGAYDVAIRVITKNGAEERATRHVEVERDRVVELDLAGLGPP